MKSNLSVPSVLVGLCCIGIIMAGYMPDDLPLVFVESHQSSLASSNGGSVTRVSLDGKHVYYVSGATTQLYVREATTGQLTASEIAYNDGYGGNGTASCVSPDGTRFYQSAMAVHVPDLVRAFRRDEHTGELTHHQGREFTQEEVDRVRPLTTYEVPILDDIACSHDGKHVYGVSGFGNAMLVFDCNGDELSLKQVFQDNEFPQSTLNGHLLPSRVKGAEVIDGLYDAKSVLVSPDDRFVYVSARIDQSIAVFRRDADSGRLEQIQFLSNVRRLPPPPGAVSTEMSLGGSLAFSPAANHIYVLYFGRVSLLARDAETGNVKYAGVVGHSSRDSIPSLEKASSLVVSKSGKHVFVASTGDKFSHRGAITIFTRDAATGELEFLKAVDRSEVAGARHLSLSPDGRHLYVSTRHQTLAVFAVNEDPNEAVSVEVEVKSEHPAE